jgi:hypothetical protein
MDSNMQYAALANLVGKTKTTNLVKEARFQALEELQVRNTQSADALLSALKPRTSIPTFNTSNRLDLISQTIA